MKKFYAIAAAGLMALTANAADYYLIGGFNNWTTKDSSCKFEESSTAGEYVLNYEGTLSSGFKINDGTWDNPAANFGGSAVLEVGKVYALTVGGSSPNIPLSGNIENPQLVLNVSDAANPTLLIRGQETEASYSYVLWGSFEGGSDWGGINMTEKNGKYTAEATVADCEFGIRKVDDATGGQAAWIASATASETAVPVNVGTAMDVKVDGNNFSLAAGTYTFTLDIDAMTLLVSGEGGGDVPTPPTGDYKDLYLVGDFNGWATAGGPKFDRKDNVYTLVLEDGLTGAWKICDGTWDYNFGAGSDAALESGVEADAWYKSGLNFTSSFSGKTTIVFTLVEGSDVADTSIPAKIKVTAEAVAEPDPVEDWYVSILGNFNEWIGDGVNPTSEGVVEFKNVAIGTSEFKVKVWNGLADNWYSTGEAVALNTPVVIPGNNDNNMTIEGATEGASYDVAFNVLTNTLTVSSASGISSVAVENGEAVYFNLQGMKVSNPENGVFVKVVNGKAVKVVK